MTRVLAALPSVLLLPSARAGVPDEFLAGRPMLRETPGWKTLLGAQRPRLRRPAREAAKAGKQEVEFLLRRVQEELARNREILAPEALAEYNEAVDFYRNKLEGSR